MVRVRFAPSPTGALHIGGIRTALYNWLFARKHSGTFILRIEDTDQNRFVKGAEEYIIDSLKWAGLTPDEGVGFGGDCAPYRQSERKIIYQEYTEKLIASGWGYYAFDTPEELQSKRDAAEAKGDTFIYNHSTRLNMRNSISLSAEETAALLAANTPYIVRLRVPIEETVSFEDIVRGWVHFNSDELDDKVMLKADGLPTYHLANVVDDRLMCITHVIRGEEWLPSTPTHVLLYRAFGWEEEMPRFAHLPLILKPSGKGKLSKRDGASLGIPVFPQNWFDEKSNEVFAGFRGAGILPEAMINFLAFLGWSPSNSAQEIFTREELIAAFDLEQIHKAGARFDFEKAKWFNQTYILRSDADDLYPLVNEIFEDKKIQIQASFLKNIIQLFKERAVTLHDFVDKTNYVWGDIVQYEADGLNKARKKWSPELKNALNELTDQISDLAEFTPDTIKQTVEQFAQTQNIGFGLILPVLRMASSGTMQGPTVFDIMALLGKEKSVQRLKYFLNEII